MAPLQPQPQTPAATQTLQHFTHPNHPLHKLQIAEEYNCDGCNTLGFGERYHCPACDFDLHERCATCPTVLHPSNLHPRHSLTLVHCPISATEGRFCDICRDLVNGLFYTCPACEFDVHPLCTQLPPQVHHPLHPYHPLNLRAASPGLCGICQQVCASWRYRCDTCNVDVHLECLTAALPSLTTWVPPAPPGHGGYPMGAASPALGVNTCFNQVQGGGAVNGSGKNKIYKVIGKLATRAVLTSMLGFPI